MANSLARLVLAVLDVGRAEAQIGNRQSEIGNACPQLAFLTKRCDEAAQTLLPARLATKGNAGVLAKYVEAGRPSVTQQAEPYPSPQ